MKLNLQAASLLINLDIPWNPAVPEQRIGRIYRIGQKDEKDGKTYLKIPVENEKVIENALALFAGIFSQKKN